MYLFHSPTLNFTKVPKSFYTLSWPARVLIKHVPDIVQVSITEAVQRKHRWKKGRKEKREEEETKIIEKQPDNLERKMHYISLLSICKLVSD